jgi:antitoxin (DNA-binding transcriptional repressor) of toxin-antitoxin stability system
MSTITIQDAQANFPALLARIAAGESIVLTDQDKAVAEMKPVAPPEATQKRRQFGLSKGEFVVPDDFMHACADEIRDEFEGKYSTFWP